MDDILDITSTEEEMGKSLSDQRNHKATFVTLLGLEKARRQVEAYTKEIEDLLAQMDLKDSSSLRRTIRTLQDRTN